MKTKAPTMRDLLCAELAITVAEAEAQGYETAEAIHAGVSGGISAGAIKNKCLAAFRAGQAERVRVRYVSGKIGYAYRPKRGG